MFYFSICNHNAVHSETCQDHEMSSLAEHWTQHLVFKWGLLNLTFIQKKLVSPSLLPLSLSPSLPPSFLDLRVKLLQNTISRPLQLHKGVFCHSFIIKTSKKHQAKYNIQYTLKINAYPDSMRMWATWGNDPALLAFFWPGQNRCEPKVAHVVNATFGSHITKRIWPIFGRNMAS